MRYIDTESGQEYTLQQLETWYYAHAAEVQENSGACTFSEYMQNCTDKNGFLAPVHE